MFCGGPEPGGSGDGEPETGADTGGGTDAGCGARRSRRILAAGGRNLPGTGRVGAIRGAAHAGGVQNPRLTAGMRAVPVN